jgi:hypothetical protein
VGWELLNGASNYSIIFLLNGKIITFLESKTF